MERGIPVIIKDGCIRLNRFLDPKDPEATIEKFRKERCDICPHVVFFLYSGITMEHISCDGYRMPYAKCKNFH